MAATDGALSAPRACVTPSTARLWHPPGSCGSPSHHRWCDRGSRERWELDEAENAAARARQDVEVARQEPVQPWNSSHRRTVRSPHFERQRSRQRPLRRRRRLRRQPLQRGQQQRPCRRRAESQLRRRRPQVASTTRIARRHGRRAPHRSLERSPAIAQRSTRTTTAWPASSERQQRCPEGTATSAALARS